MCCPYQKLHSGRSNAAEVSSIGKDDCDWHESVLCGFGETSRVAIKMLREEPSVDSGGDSLVAMVQATDLGNFHDPAYFRRLNGPTDRGISKDK